MTDAEKIANALRAGPAFITKEATLLDWPAAPGGEYWVLRKGSNEWTCLPGIPGYPHDEPRCFDPVFLQWIQDSLAGRMPHTFCSEFLAIFHDCRDSCVTAALRVLVTLDRAHFVETKA